MRVCVCVCVCVCSSGHLLSGICTKAPGPISFHLKTCHIHCPFNSSVCSSVPSCVSVILETVASTRILVVLRAGNLLAILLPAIKGCVLADRHTQILATWTLSIATLCVKKPYIITEFHRSPTCSFTVWACFLTFRQRASCIIRQAFHYTPKNAFYIFNQQIYFII